MSSHRILIAFAFVALLSVLGSGEAQAQSTFWVDGASGSDTTGDGSQGNPYATIQFGYDAAGGGDTVRVLPGTYNECLTLAGIATDKPIDLVADAYLASGDNTSTIIQGDGSCAAVVIGSSASSIQGFTVTNAGFTGIFGFGSTVITNNVVTGNSSTFGGGIYFYSASCYYGAVVGNISNNDVNNNSAEFDGTCSNSSVACTSNANCNPSDPSDTCEGTGGDGGGVYVFAVGTAAGGPTGCLAGDVDVTVANNAISNNDADNAFGAGLVVFTNTALGRTAEVIVTDNLINTNVTLPGAVGYGGGAWLTTYGYGDEDIEFTGNTVTSNSSTGDGGGVSAWINTLSQADHRIVLDDNLISGNAADGNGGGLDMFMLAVGLNLGQSTNLTAQSNMVVNNSADGSFGGAGGILGTFFSQRSMSNSLIFNILSNEISNNTALVSGGGVGLVSSADADPDIDGNTTPGTVAGINLSGNLIDSNNATDGFSAVGGGVFAYAEAFGPATSRIDMYGNTVASNTSDVGSGGIELESRTEFDFLSADEGTVDVVVNSSIISDNTGFGIGGPTPGTAGVLTTGGTGNFNGTSEFNNVSLNTSGNFEGVIPIGGNDSTVDPLLNTTTLRPTACSPTIDAGDTLLGFTFEPVPNGGRINQGHTGNTANATGSLPDTDGDRTVDGAEIVQVSVAFGTSQAAMDPRYDVDVDLNGDGFVDGVDLALFAAAFGLICP